MSFLNPIAWSPRLGVGITSLLGMSDQQQGPGESGLAWFVDTATSAGADTVVLALPAPALVPQQRHVDAVLGAMAESRLDIPLSDATVDYVCTVRPNSVCFRAGLTAQDGSAGNDKTDTWLHIQQAVTRLNALSVSVMISIEPDPALLSHLHQAGVTSVELNTMHFAQSPQKAEALQSLRSTANSAKRLGMAVHLGHGIQYRHIQQLALIADIDQINVGHAISARALMVGWAAAVIEMKALLVSARSSLYRADSIQAS